ELVREHMDALFGPDRAEELRQRLSGMPSGERELTIVEELVEALKSIGGEFVLPFRFRNEEGSRTSHHLIFVSKHVRGYQIMKDMGARDSPAARGGAPSFDNTPADRHYPVLFEYSRPLDDLEGLLLERFAGRRLKMVQVYAEHNVGTPFVQANYKEAL